MPGRCLCEFSEQRQSAPDHGWLPCPAGMWQAIDIECFVIALAPRLEIAGLVRRALVEAVVCVADNKFNMVGKIGKTWRMMIQPITLHAFENLTDGP